MNRRQDSIPLKKIDLSLVITDLRRKKKKNILMINHQRMLNKDFLEQSD